MFNGSKKTQGKLFRFQKIYGKTWDITLETHEILVLGSTDKRSNLLAVRFLVGNEEFVLQGIRTLRRHNYPFLRKHSGHPYLIANG